MQHNVPGQGSRSGDECNNHKASQKSQFYQNKNVRLLYMALQNCSELDLLSKKYLEKIEYWCLMQQFYGRGGIQEPKYEVWGKYEAKPEF